MQSSFNLSKALFTKESDIVEPGLTIFNPIFSSVHTLKGDDQLIGNISIIDDFGFQVISEAETEGLDTSEESMDINMLIGEAIVDGNGLENRGIINTNQGQDIVQGWANANVSTQVETVASAFAVVRNFSASSIASAFASIDFQTIVDGIDNVGGRINTNDGNDNLGGEGIGSIEANAIATINSSAIIEAIATIPLSEELVAFSDAIAISLLNATVIARGINNNQGKITTGPGHDIISSIANTDSIAIADGTANILAQAPEGNRALATGTVQAIAQATGNAIAIDNTGGYINTGKDNDTIIAQTENEDPLSYGIFGGKIFTGDGEDRVITSKFGGHVEIFTEAGNDYVAGFGTAQLFGGKGFDTLNLETYTEEDFDAINIVEDNVDFSLDGMTLSTHGFEQFIFAKTNQDSNDHFLGSQDNEPIIVGGGEDIVYSGSGSDLILGQEGDDILDGGDGNDSLDGGTGDDILRGGVGHDILNSGLGDDILIGGPGRDRFIISGIATGRDVIVDYEDGVDVLELIEGITFESLTFNQNLSGTEIINSSTHEILAILVNINTLDIDISDFADEHI